MDELWRLVVQTLRKKNIDDEWMSYGDLCYRLQEMREISMLDG
jgi:hypothetical protein